MSTAGEPVPAEDLIAAVAAAISGCGWTLTDPDSWWGESSHGGGVWLDGSVTPAGERSDELVLRLSAEQAVLLRTELLDQRDRWQRYLDEHPRPSPSIADRRIAFLTDVLAMLPPKRAPFRLRGYPRQPPP